jgi:hypothetical protein
LSNQWLWDCDLSIKADFIKYIPHKDIQILLAGECKDILWSKKKIKSFFIYYEFEMKVNNDIAKGNTIITLHNQTKYRNASKLATVRINGICDDTFLKKIYIQEECYLDIEKTELINTHTLLKRGMILQWGIELIKTEMDIHYAKILYEYAKEQEDEE